jgi:hypothetical protein
LFFQSIIFYIIIILTNRHKVTTIFSIYIF